MTNLFDPNLGRKEPKEKDMDELVEELCRRLQREYTNFSMENLTISSSELKVFALLYLKLQGIISHIYSRKNMHLDLDEIYIIKPELSSIKHGDDGDIVNIEDVLFKLAFNSHNMTSRSVNKDYFESNGKLYDSIIQNFMDKFGYNPNKDEINRNTSTTNIYTGRKEIVQIDDKEESNPFKFDELI